MWEAGVGTGEPRMPGVGGLFERDTELALLEGLIKQVSGGTGALALIEGPSGIGKTSLVAIACDRARAAGLVVVSGRGGVLDREQPFGIARRLLDVLVKRSAMRAVPRNAYSSLDTLCAIVGRAAIRTPLLLCLDDAHLVDRESMRLFVALASRVGQYPVLLLLAARHRAPEAEQELLAALATDAGAIVLRPAPLSESAVARWIGERLGDAPAGAFAEACVTATGGNPFLVAELLRTLRAERVEPGGHNVSRVAAFAPEGVSRAVCARLARLSTQTDAVARALSVLGGRGDAGLLAALTELDLDHLAQSLDALIDADVLARSDPPEFLHPMVCSAVYEDTPLSRRDALHLRAARLLAARAPREIESIAAHLMATRARGDDWIVASLADAAQHAMRGNAPEAASRYLRRALTEPPDPERVVGLLVALGDADAAGGQPAAAVAALSEALPRIEGAERRAEVARALGQSLVRADRGVEAAEVLVAAIHALPLDNPELGMRLEADLEVIAHLDARAGRTLAGRRSRFEGGLGGARSNHARLALAGRADHEMNRGTASEAARFARLALDGVELLGPDGPEPVFFFSTAIVLLYSDHLDDAERVYNDAIASAERHTQSWAAQRARGFRAGVHYRRGALAAAEADARFALAGQPRTLGLGTTFAGAFLIDALIDRGKVSAAAATATEVGADGPLPDALISTLIQHARGRLRSAQLDHAGALEDFLECGRNAAEWDMRTPAVANWSASAAQALDALGHHEEAASRARDGLTAARGFGSPRALGIGLTALGLITADITALEEAVSVLRSSQARLELARALVALGGAFRRRGQRARARELLQEGLRLSRACGATPLAALAHEELAASGSRPRKILRAGTDALTPSELRVARLAAAGQSNREIADRLILSIRTIETHLARTYQKLDITSRHELQTTLGVTDTARPGAPVHGR